MVVAGCGASRERHAGGGVGGPREAHGLDGLQRGAVARRGAPLVRRRSAGPRAIHAALKREHGFAGSYSAVVRMLQRLRQEEPPDVTVRCA
jgi:hypothetical protein